MEKKYKTLIYIIACLSGLAMGIAIVSLTYFHAWWFNPPVFEPGWTTMEQLQFTSYAWVTNNTYCNITVKNIGPLNSSIAQIQVNGKSVTPNTPALPYALAKGQQVIIKVTSAFNSGTQYTFWGVTTKGNQFGPLSLTPP